MEIPERVITLLAEVRETGAVNMLDRMGVAAVASDLVEGSDAAEDYAAIVWIAENKDQYMAALREMGNRRAK